MPRGQAHTCCPVFHVIGFPREALQQWHAQQRSWCFFQPMNAAKKLLPLQDPGEAAAHLDEAKKRLLHAISFARGDPAPMCALGEVCSLQAEHSLQQDPADAAEATAQLQAAVEQGYGAALRIDRACPDALVGMAEVHALLGKMAATAGGLQTCLTTLYCKVSAPVLVPLKLMTEVRALLVQLAATVGGFCA